MRARPLMRRVSSLGRIFIALALLLGVWYLASSEVDDATEQAESRRLEDRKELAAGFAGVLKGWLDAGHSEAQALAEALGREPTPAKAIDTHREASDRRFAEVVVLAPGDRIVAASTGPAAANPTLRQCDTSDVALTALLKAARSGQRPISVARVPWDCGTERLAAAVAAGSNVALVLARLDEGTVQLGAAMLRPTSVGPLTIEFVEPTLESDSSAERIAFVRGARGKALVVGRYAGLLGVYAEAGDGWGVTVEQLASDFDRDRLAIQPGGVGAGVLAAALGVAFVLLAFFDYRRRKALSRAEEAKHAFFATVGHELRTPLTILKGYSDTLTARWDSLSDDAKEMLVSNMAPAAQRLAGLVEKLILASNIQAEAYIKPVARPTAVADVLQQVAARWRPLAPLHTFVVDVDPLLPEALADADALEHVLQQLLDNAVKYSPSGGRVTLSAMRAKRGMEISVSDEGVGLPQNAHEIFDPLVQGEAVDTRVHDEGGAGVGLFIVRTLVRDMGGSVRAEGQKPTGSRFVVALRAAKTKTAARPVTRV